MGKQGPCCHCGVTSTPLWRNGPPDKPVLCNACGSRWRTKGSLVNYTPMHRKDDTDDGEPRVNKLKPPTSKPKAQKLLKKKPNHTIMENGLFSGQNFRKMGDADPSRSSSGSAVSYSESCAPYGAVEASEITGSVQSHAWESLVPSRKRSCVTRPKPSPVEKLAKDLNSIMHEEQLYYLSGSSEEDLLYHSETPVGSFEIGSGSVLLRHPNSKSLEEESEASSIPAENKSYITSESYSGSASFVVHSGSKGASYLNAASERPKGKGSCLQIGDNARRDKLHYENQHILESVDSPLVSANLEGVINYTNFIEFLTDEEQKQLLKLLPPMDSMMPHESLREVFSSEDFARAINNYQKLLREGILDPSFCDDAEWRTVKRLALTNLTKWNWLGCYNYKQQKDKEIKEIGQVENINGLNDITKSSMKPLKRSHDTHFQISTDLEGTMRSPKRVLKSGTMAALCTNSSFPMFGNAPDGLACTGGALNIFMLPPEKLSMLVPPQYINDDSDQDLLLEVPLNARHPEAELLCQPSHLKSVTRGSTSVGRVSEGDGRLKQP